MIRQSSGYFHNHTFNLCRATTAVHFLTDRATTNRRLSFRLELGEGNERKRVSPLLVVQRRISKASISIRSSATFYTRKPSLLTCWHIPSIYLKQSKERLLTNIRPIKGEPELRAIFHPHTSTPWETTRMTSTIKLKCSRSRN